MSQHARIEEVSDSDLDSDPSEQDPADFADALIRPAFPTRPVPTSPLPPPPPLSSSSILQPQFRAPPPSSLENDHRHKRYQCLYPLYFDAGRTRAQGRRVGHELAVPNPLAREIVEAAQLLGLDTVFEPGKVHPKDWSNPGRVRVLVKEGGRARNRGVKNKHHLYTLVAKHLLAHPTTPESPLRLRIHGMPPPSTPIPAPAVPRGWKMNSILPLHSPALSGGGVSENILQDMMAEMQGAGAAQAAGMGMAPGGSKMSGREVSERGGGTGQGKRKRERDGGRKR